MAYRALDCYRKDFCAPENIIWYRRYCVDWRYILVDAKLGRILKVHTDISGPEIKKIMDETQFQPSAEPYKGYGGYGGYGRGGYRPPPRSRKTTRRPPPAGEFGEEEVA